MAITTGPSQCNPRCQHHSTKVNAYLGLTKLFESLVMPSIPLSKLFQFQAGVNGDIYTEDHIQL